MTEDVQTLWPQVREGLRAFVAKRVTGDAAVDDILQDVVLRMHEKIDRVKDPRRLVSWIYQITRHAIVDYYRAAHRRREIPAGLADELESDSSSEQHEQESDGGPRSQLAACLRPMVDRLSPEYRQAITLVEFDGLTQEAAARQLRLSVSGMKSRVQRGRQQLKHMLQACCSIQLDARRGVTDFSPRDPTCDPCAPPGPIVPTRIPTRHSAV